MNGNGPWKRLPTVAFLVPTGEAVTAVQALVIQPLAVMTIARLTASTILVSVQHFMQTKS